MDKFRRDINGLRALAVLGVLLYHFDLPLFKGGFSGVDVFFVISGYLMTKIIVESIDHDSFDFKAFYLARFNRIVPPLLVLLVFLLISCWFILPPEGYKSLGKHAASSLLFLSNVVYSMESGYFDVGAKSKWLLHTWSLSIEWQFYLIYPILLVFLKKLVVDEKVRISILIITIFGFIIGLVVSYLQLANPYFSIFSRFWEMLVGGVAYYYPLKTKGRINIIVKMFSLVTILLGYFFLNSSLIWPGVFSVLPVMATYVYIACKDDEIKVINHRLFQSIGSASYSIYLWHWPTVVLLNYMGERIENKILIGVTLSLILGYLSYVVVEKRNTRKEIRLKSFLSSRFFLLYSFLFLISAVIFLSQGLLKMTPERFQKVIATAKYSPMRDSCHISSYRPPSQSCVYNKGELTWAVLGDSHATEIAYALSLKLNNTGEALKHYTFSACPPSYKSKNFNTNCYAWYNESVKDIIKNDSIRTVVINHRFTNALVGGNAFSYPLLAPYDESIDSGAIIQSIDKLINELSMHKDNIYIFLPIPELQERVQYLIGERLKSGNDYSLVPGTDIDYYLKRNENILRYFENANYPNNVHIIDIRDVFCDDAVCYAIRNGKSLYFDDNHPSIYAAKKIVDKIVSVN